MAVDTLVESPQSALSGVARVLVHAGKLSAKAAEDLARSAKERRTSFVSAVVMPARCPPAELAHTLSTALALPLLDLNAVDLTRLPRGIVEPKLALQYQLMVLGKRGNRLFIAAADPTDQEAVERIKFATQLSPEWVIVEYDKLVRVLETQGASVNEAMEQLAGGDFEFDVTDEDTAAQEGAEVSQEVEDAPVVRFLQKMLIDAINMRAPPTCISSPTSTTTGCAFASTASCARSPSRRSPSRTSWPRASRSSRAWTLPRSACRKTAG